ncbi:MAG: hypothetical protein Q9187_009036 [Circinaria calcarea]
MPKSILEIFPAEILLRIFEFALHADHHNPPDPMNDGVIYLDCVSADKTGQQPNVAVALLRTCHAVYHAALPFLYENSITFGRCGGDLLLVLNASEVQSCVDGGCMTTMSLPNLREVTLFIDDSNQDSCDWGSAQCYEYLLRRLTCQTKLVVESLALVCKPYSWTPSFGPAQFATGLENIEVTRSLVLYGHGLGPEEYFSAIPKALNMQPKPEFIDISGSHQYVKYHVNKSKMTDKEWDTCFQKEQELKAAKVVAEQMPARMGMRDVYRQLLNIQRQANAACTAEVFRCEVEARNARQAGFHYVEGSDLMACSDVYWTCHAFNKGGFVSAGKIKRAERFSAA